MPNNVINKRDFKESSHLINRPVFLAIVVFFLLIKVSLSLFWPAREMPLASDLSQENILNAVNKERLLRNLATLTTNGKLGLAAQSKADDMQSRHYFAHVDPDGHYIWDKIVEAGYTPYLQLGENLAIEFYDTNSLMSAWMNSPTHRANIIQEGFKDQGMGLTFGDTKIGQYYSAIANTFGTQAIVSKPKKQTPPQTVETPPPVVEQTKLPVATPQNKPVETQKQIVPAPIIATPSPASVPRQVETRGIADSGSEPNFALPQTTHSPNSSSTPLPASTSLPTEQLTDLISQTQKPAINNYEINRYLILVCAIALLFLMLSDLKTAIQNKLGSLDKKVNNLIVLLISIIVIAFMYWL